MTYRYVLNHNRKRVHRLNSLGGSIFRRPAADTTDFLDILLTGRDPAMREFLAEDGKRVAAVT